MIPAIGLASGLGGSNEGSGLGPDKIREKFIEDVFWKKTIRKESEVLDKVKQIASLNQKLAEEVYETVMEHPFTFVIGGDHSCAIGTWSGAAEALRAQGEEDMGIIWIDAHMDSHTPESTPSGNIHGMPLAALMGYGTKELTQLISSKPKLKPENLFLVGIRSFEEQEQALLEKLNVRVYYIEEVHQRGLKAIFDEIIAYFERRDLSYGLSLDIDFFDPEKMSATGTPEKNGAEPQEFIDNYDCFDRYPPVLFEYVEFNPLRDTENQSLNWSLRILERAMKTRFADQKKKVFI